MLNDALERNKIVEDFPCILYLIKQKCLIRQDKKRVKVKIQNLTNSYNPTVK